MAAPVNSLEAHVEACLQSLRENDWKHDSDQYRRQIHDVAKVLQNSQTAVVQVVELLGPHLTNTDAAIRAGATCILADVLESLPTVYLKSAETVHLASFFCDRLKDHYSVVPHAVRSLVMLTGSSTLADSCAKPIAEAVFKEVHNQSQTQGVRLGVYTIFNNLLRYKLPELQTLGENFVFNYVQAMDGERDPRNLVIIFSTIPYVTQHFKIDIFAEELFEVTSCYFPIDFTPPPNNPDGITREALVSNLRACLASSPILAPYCLPLLLEKLDADIVDSKVDALQTLAECFPVYGSQQLKPFTSAIWRSIRREVFTGRNEEVDTAALHTLTALSASVSKGIIDETSISVLENLLEEVLKDCIPHLHEPELKLVHPSGRLLLSVATSSNQAFHAVNDKVLPLLLEEFIKHPQVNKRKTILELMNKFLSAYQLVADDHVKEDAVIRQAVPLLLSLLNEASQEVCQLGIQGLAAIFALQGILTHQDEERAAQHLVTLALQSSQEDVRKSAIDSLRILIQFHASVATAFVLPVCMEAITNGLTADLSVSSTYQNALHVVEVLCLDPLLQVTILSKLVDHFRQIAALPTEGSANYLMAVVQCIRNIITNSDEKTAVASSYESLYLPLLDGMVSTQLISINSFQENIALIASMGALLGEIVRRSTSIQAETILKFVVPKYLLTSNDSGKGDTEHSWTGATKVFLVLLDSTLCSIPKQAQVPLLDELLAYLEEAALDAPHDVIVLSAMHVFASIINKMSDGEFLSSKLADIEQRLSTRLFNKDVSNLARVLSLWCWLTKALLLRGHPKMESFLTKLLELFNESDICESASNSFCVIVEDSTTCLTHSTHATIRFMHRQRLFQLSIPRLMEMASASINQSHHSIFLSAIIHQVRFLPLEVLLDKLPPLLPLLVQALSFDDTALLLTTLATLASLLHRGDSAIVSYTSTLIPHFLRLAQTGATMKVRMEALDCIKRCTSLPTPLLIPLQKQVVRELGPCLDDKKRLVRQKAAAARSQWFLVGSPGGLKAS